jgi:pyruvate/2-oxoglutarate dehydrogenase complex dihydrolipoamide dehydrogenase (E3) component
LRLNDVPFDTVPEYLLVLGGGYVGFEFAQAFQRFGSRVTVVERNSVLAHREDRDVSEALPQLFREEGTEVTTSTIVDHVEGRSGESVRLHATRDGMGWKSRSRGPISWSRAVASRIPTDTVGEFTGGRQTHIM